jgi:hypothetical protein
MAVAFRDREALASPSHMAQAWLRLADRYQDAEEVRPVVQQRTRW